MRSDGDEDRKATESGVVIQVSQVDRGSSKQARFSTTSSKSGKSAEHGISGRTADGMEDVLQR